MDVELKQYLDVAREAAKLGGEVLLSYFGRLKSVSEKFQAGLVSEADVASEKVIIQHLKKFFPNIPVLGEETGLDGQAQSLDPHSGYMSKDLWMLDPLDGTTNYVHTLPFYCVSLGLQLGKTLQVGVCYLPSLGIEYYAGAGLGAFKNGSRIQVSERGELNTTLLATGFSSYEKSDIQMSIFSSLVNKVRGIRRVGSAAYDLCLVAEGAFDGYWEKGLSAWDTAAGALIVKEAGGKVTNYRGEDFDPFDNTIVACNAKFHSVLQSHISNHIV